MNKKPALSEEQKSMLLKKLRTRFLENMPRHKGLSWGDVEKKVLAYPGKCISLFEMEKTGGEPDVTGFIKKTGEFIFMDCSAESPAGRRSLCYDKEALVARKEHKPKNSAVQLATSMGIELLTEEEYRALQQLGKFDSKTSSWIKTPPEIRKLGGAVFCDRRYNTVFIYHNSAESYYASRGFRGSLLL